MYSQTDLTESQWQIAHAMAIALAKTETDPNEISKALTYLRAFGHQKDAGKNFFNYLTTLHKNGDRIGHGKRTKEYYGNLEFACNQYLENYQNNVSEMTQILGWVVRLLRYYKTTPVGELTTPQITVQPQSAPINNKTYTVGEALEATITNIKRTEVTFSLSDTGQKLTNKEPKHCQNLKLEQKVTIEITAVKEDGTIKKVKYSSSGS